FGLPLAPAGATPSTGTSSFTAQLFERERIELHPELAAPYNVSLGRLGDELLQRAGRDWRTEGAGQQLPGQCRTFAQTGRTVCGAFLDYWQSHGLNLGDGFSSDRASLALFGYPLTAPQLETNSSGDRVLTQWFERARFELHPNLVQPVLLGRLGAEWSGQTSIALPLLEAAAAPQSVAQGHTFLINLATPHLVAARGTLDGVALPFVNVANVWRAFAGIPVLTPLGSLRVHLEGDLSDGRTIVNEFPITVLDARYPREAITLPPSVTDSLNQNQDAVLRERQIVNAIWRQTTAERLWQGPFILPAQGVISSDFGTLRSYNGGPYDSFHEGLDIANVVGTPIIAPARGRVVLAEPDFLVRGGAVILDHGWGVHTGFWHQSQILVKVGDMVEQGQIIGRMGAKGMVTGPHVHWDVRIGSTNVSPLEWTQTNHD
ncbi:MAG: M23 family metallopeptidase, partial [Herpetosiphonaceae bacterium]|nr:M23 family metallopeptidase [Herpetosiphonaceae bacterium]